MAEEPAPEPQSAIVSYVPPPNSLPDFQGQPHSSYRSPALRHQRRRRNAYRRRRRRRLDNPRWYHPNADYIPEEEQTSWENYRRRPYRKRDAELPQQGSYRPYVLPLEPEPNAARFKNEDNRLDLQVGRFSAHIVQSTISVGVETFIKSPCNCMFISLHECRYVWMRVRGAE